MFRNVVIFRNSRTILYYCQIPCKLLGEVKTLVEFIGWCQQLGWDRSQTMTHMIVLTTCTCTVLFLVMFSSLVRGTHIKSPRTLFCEGGPVTPEYVCPMAFLCASIVDTTANDLQPSNTISSGVCCPHCFCHEHTSRYSPVVLKFGPENDLRNIMAFTV